MQKKREGKGVRQGQNPGYSAVSTEGFSTPMGSSTAGRTFRVATVGHAPTTEPRATQQETPQQ